MLCLNCIYARDGVPERVEVEIKINEEVKKVDVTEEFKGLWKSAVEMGYSATIFCDKLKEVKVGTPPNPACTVTECAEFAEA